MPTFNTYIKKNTNVESSSEKGLREAREYANKMLAGQGSHQDFSDLTNVLLVGMSFDPEYDVIESDHVVKRYMETNRG